jgi:phosphatidylglycerol---prolipoprotein diacylglyceryl transferase
MYSELFRIPISFHGVPIFGVGVVLAIWLLVGGWGMLATAKEAGWAASLRAHLLTLALVAAAIIWLVPNYFPEGLPIRGYGLMVLAGSAAGIGMSIHRARQAGISPDEIVGLAVAMFILGVVGARAFFVIEYWETIRQDDWLGTLKAALSYTEGGLVVYGAFIGAMLAFAWYVRRRGLPALAMADLIAPGMVAGLAFGRLGCLLNGCCYGGETDAAWAVTFPRERAAGEMTAPYAEQVAAGRMHGLRFAGAAGADGRLVIKGVDAGSPADEAGVKAGDVVTAINGATENLRENAGRILIDVFENRRSLQLQTAAGETKTIPAVDPPPRCRPVHPTQIYSAVNAGLLSWFLWSIYPFRRRDGEVTALMITIYPVARYFEEVIRIDEPSVFGTGLSISQNISAILLLGAVGMWIWLLRRPAGELAFPVGNERGHRASE